MLQSEKFESSAPLLKSTWCYVPSPMPFKGGKDPALCTVDRNSLNWTPYPVYRISVLDVSFINWAIRWDIYLLVLSWVGWLNQFFYKVPPYRSFLKMIFFLFVFASVADPEPLLVWIRLQLITKILVQKTCSVIFVIFVMFIDSNELYETVRT